MRNCGIRGENGWNLGGRDVPWCALVWYVWEMLVVCVGDACSMTRRCLWNVLRLFL